jgi:hypothetical protein
MKLVSIVIVSIILVSAALARAAHAEPPSPTGALAWSIGGTLAGVGVTAGGIEAQSGEIFLGGELILAVGPSAGHFYAGETSHGLVVSGLRAGAIALFDYGVGASVGCGIDDHSTNDCADGPAVAAIAGLAAVAGLTIYDWIDAPRAAHRAAARASDLTIAPLADRRGAGLAIVGRF